MSSVDQCNVKTEHEEEASQSQDGSEQTGSTEFLEALIHHGNSKKQGSAFLEKLYEILMNEEYENFISWCADGKSILIKKVEDFSQIVLPKYYKHNNFQSFVRQLNMYNFTKTSHDANRREFKQPLFRKGKRNLLPLISRKTQKALRSLDSSDNIDATDIFDVAISHSERLEGKPLIRCKSIDSCPAVPENESSPLWEVVQELQMRVIALEMKLHQASRDKQGYKQDNMFLHDNSSCIHNHSPNFDTSNDMCSTSSTPNNNDDCCPILKKIRSNSDKSSSSSSCSSALSEEEEDYFRSGRKPRSISLGSNESSSTSSCSSCTRRPGIDSPRAKRGVDAILSAAEILHDKGRPQLLPPHSSNGQGTSEEETLDISTSATSHNSKTEINQSLKKLKTSQQKTSSVAESSSNYVDMEACDSLSDSSTSPLYFQENEDLECNSTSSLDRKAGLLLSRTSTIS